MRKEDKNIYYCVGCGTTHPKGNFYVSYSPDHANGRLFYCKDFIKSKAYMGDKVILNEFKKLLREFNIPFLNDTYESAIESKGDTIGHYFRMFNSLNQNRGLTWDNSVFIDDNAEKLVDGEPVDNTPKEDSYDLIDFEITDDVKSFWGMGLEDEEYYTLQGLYSDFVNNYECDSPVQMILFKNASRTQLNIDKALIKNDINMYDKLVKTLSTILGDSNIKPVQETGANATEQATFGTLIKKWENEEPIPDPLPEWKEKDIFEYVKIWFLGHLSKMLNLDNPYQEDYDKELKEYEVEMSSDDFEGDA